MVLARDRRLVGIGKWGGLQALREMAKESSVVAKEEAGHKLGLGLKIGNWEFGWRVVSSVTLDTKGFVDLNSVRCVGHENNVVVIK